MRLAVLVVTRNRPDLVADQVANLSACMPPGVDWDLHIVEMGTDLDRISPHSTLWYPDPEFKGKAWGHNQALQAARLSGPYDYYWVLMNDVVLDPSERPVERLLATMEAHPECAVLSPSEPGSSYAAADRQPGGGLRKVTTCDYLCFVMRASAVDEVGFLNPAFTYSWGAIHELSYKLYRAGGFVAYTDAVSYVHLGGTTYGNAATNTISREEYQRRAKRFAFDYMLANYGWDWPELFWAVTAGHDIEVNAYPLHREIWASGFAIEELEQRRAVARGETAPPREEVKLHLGCGLEKRAGWVNVDVNPEVEPDVVASVDALSPFGDASVDRVEANHLFEHLDHTTALRALSEWRRVLRPGGVLELELPDMEGCIRILGKYQGDDGMDLGMVGLFGFPRDVDTYGVPQLHKWGWSVSSLSEALVAAGFSEVQRVPLSQTGRLAAVTGRDMRLRAVASGAPCARTSHMASPVGAWPLATDARWRLLAWPRWDSPDELGALLARYGPALARRDDAVLCLRLDPALDGDPARAVAHLQAAYATHASADEDIAVLLVDEPCADPVRLGRSVHWVLPLPSGEEPARQDFLSQLGVPGMADAATLADTLARFDAAAPGATPRRAALPPREPSIQDKADALNPWFYPVTLGGYTVTPGVGSPNDAEFLTGRTAGRATLLVDEITRRLDLSGKSMLDLACNCAHWGSRYTQHGLARYVGVEGRELFVDQARLYWATEGFLPQDHYAILRGNALDEELWARLRTVAPFDLTLCAGLLYHIPEYRQLLSWVASVTREAIIIDTRVGGPEEALVEEPGDVSFNAIEATRAKRVPHLPHLLGHLHNLGFDSEVLTPRFGSPYGLRDVDDYTAGNRVTLLARRMA